MSINEKLKQTRQERISGWLKKTACILRAFNNEFVADQVKSLLNMGVGIVIVVVDQQRDGSGQDTLEYLKGYSNDSRVKVEYIPANFGWSVALNWGVRSIKTQNRVHNLRTGLEDKLWKFVFNVSVEAKFKSDDLLTMLEQFDGNPKLGTVGTTWRGMKKGNDFDLGWTYGRPRNTGSLWRVEVFDGLEFDPWCDHCNPVVEGGVEKKLGGMEDFDLMIRANILSGWLVKMLDLKVKLIVGANWNQEAKEEREQNATRQILKRLRQQFEEDSFERSLVDEAIILCDLNLE